MLLMQIIPWSDSSARMKVENAFNNWTKLGWLKLHTAKTAAKFMPIGCDLATWSFGTTLSTSSLET